MIKKFNISMVAFALICSFLLTPAGAFAAENSQQDVEENTQQSTEQMIETLDKYIYAEDNQIKTEQIPQSVYDKFGEENVKSILSGIKELNVEAKNDELVITDNKTIYETDDDGFTVQGGVNKVVYKWYGRVRYFSTSAAKDFEYQCYKVAAGSAGVAAVTAFFSAGSTALFGGLTSWYFTNLALDVNHANSSRGIIVHVTWASAYWIDKQ
ncbi:hypothetical protein [Priestia megaterium]|uniref:hypothetical protein n=1 Tax=Priestia megaterium TaxID=1404 RepID=UPI002FDF6DC7